MHRIRGWLAGVWLAASIAAAAPFVPARDSDVLESLPERAEPGLARLRPLRAAATAQPSDLRAVAPFARAAIEAARALGDPRYLGQAQAALAPWWNDPDAPAIALLLRATIRQSLHDFDGAIADLDRLIARQPRDLQARLTRATVLTVVGRHRDALADCDALASSAPSLVAVICRASPDSQVGRAGLAFLRLREALEAQPDAEPALAVWGWTLAGEIAARRGDSAAAEAAFRRALALVPRDSYLLAAYSDFLIEAARAPEVVALLASNTQHDALLLRLVIAASGDASERARHAAWKAELAARADAARRRGDGVHRREEALIALAIDNDPARAVALAGANFDVQRGPADARVLAAAGRAARDAAALRVVEDWQRATGLEDVALARLLGSRS